MKVILWLFFLEQLNKQVDAKRDAFRKPIEEKKRNLEECLYAKNPEALEKLQKLREIELEMQFTSSEIKREEERVKLTSDLKKQPEVASRRSYIERIKEITKNGGKLDSDIERILRETRVLQLESNSIQESLHRTYVVLDDIVFRYVLTYEARVRPFKAVPRLPYVSGTGTVWRRRDVPFLPGTVKIFRGLSMDVSGRIWGQPPRLETFILVGNLS